VNRKQITRLVTGLLLVAGIFFVGRTCQAENADITLVFSNDDGDGAVSFEAAILRTDEVVAQFRASDVAVGTERRFELDLDPGSYQLELEVTRDGVRKRQVRRLEAVARATVRIELTDSRR